MSITRQSLLLTHGGVMTALQAAILHAEEIDVPQCIVLVDAKW